MKFSDYIEQVEQDAREYLAEEAAYIDHDPESAIDTLWAVDSVTGNGSGSYTFNAYQAAENAAELVFDDDFISEVEGMGDSVGELFNRAPEAVDVTARVLALYRIDWEAVYLDIFGDEDEEPEA